jgi:hypothetical protein
VTREVMNMTAETDAVERELNQIMQKVDAGRRDRELALERAQSAETPTQREERASRFSQYSALAPAISNDFTDPAHMTEPLGKLSAALTTGDPEAGDRLATYMIEQIVADTDISDEELPFRIGDVWREIGDRARAAVADADRFVNEARAALAAKAFPWGGAEGENARLRGATEYQCAPARNRADLLSMARQAAEEGDGGKVAFFVRNMERIYDAFPHVPGSNEDLFGLATEKARVSEALQSAVAKARNAPQRDYAKALDAVEQWYEKNQQQRELALMRGNLWDKFRYSVPVRARTNRERRMALGKARQRQAKKIMGE